MRRSCIALVAMVGALAAGSGSAAAQEPSGAPAIGAGCLGLQCPGQPASDAAMKAGPLAPILSTVEDAERAPAGYYRFPDAQLGTSTAVGWVAPPGTIADAPPEIQALYVVRDAVATGMLETRMAVFLEEGRVILAPPAATAVASRRRSRPVARAANQDQYGCIDAYWCVYRDINWSGYLEQIHPISPNSVWQSFISYWTQDAVSSVRNRRDRDSWLAEHSDGSGWRVCYDSHYADANLPDDIDNEASSIYNSPGDGSC